jgi:hypothetical protein
MGLSDKNKPADTDIRKGVDWNLRDAIEAAERRLSMMCDQVNAGDRQGGAREFSRMIDAEFKQIKAHPEFVALRYSN